MLNDKIHCIWYIYFYKFHVIYYVLFSLQLENMKNLQKFDVASFFRGLRMLSLVLGTEITDASVAAIASSYTNLELLDLSGYVAVSLPLYS